MSLDAIGIVSRDIKKTVDFYALFSIELKQVGGPDHYEGPTSSGVRIMVDSVDLMKKLNPNWIEPQGTPVILAFKQDTPAGVDELHGQVVSAGFKSVKEPWDAFWGQRYASVADPDGNQIDIFANL